MLSLPLSFLYALLSTVLFLTYPIIMCKKKKKDTSRPPVNIHMPRDVPPPRVSPNFNNPPPVRRVPSPVMQQELPVVGTATPEPIPPAETTPRDQTLAGNATSSTAQDKPSADPFYCVDTMPEVLRDSQYLFDLLKI